MGYFIKLTTRLQSVKSGIYKLIYSMCKCSCVGQTSSNLELRYQEHAWYIKSNSPQSMYAAHIFIQCT
jgi:hypothetical protein